MTDDPLRLERLDAATLRMLLTTERSKRQQWEQEQTRLRRQLLEQNERITQLAGHNGQLRAELRELKLQLAAVLEQNSLLRQQVSALQAENAQLREQPRGEGKGESFPGLKANAKAREKKVRRKRAAEHNHGRKRQQAVTERVRHEVAACPHCGEPLQGGWVQRRVQVIDLPVVAPLVVTEHELLGYRCPRCQRRVVAPPPGREEGRVGRCRFGPRFLSQVTSMAMVEHLSQRQIQARLEREYGLHVSQGGLVGLLQLVAKRGKPAYEHLAEQIRASPVVQGDETGWRENGQNGYIWLFATPSLCYYHRDPSRSKAVPDQILGEDFAGTLVTDFYAAYDHYAGLHQRCWSHLWRAIRQVADQHPDDGELAAWITGVHSIYRAALAERPAAEQGSSPAAVRAREERAQRYQRQLLALCPASLEPDRPQATLAKRCRKYLPELFTFVRDPAVPATNNRAEQDLRPLVIARKISGGSRSAQGSQTRMILSSLLMTAHLQGIDPTLACRQLLLGKTL